MTVSHIISNKMAVTMALFWISLVLSIIGSNAAGEFTVLYSPESLKFSGTGQTLESLLKEIFSASLGLSVEENSEWKGLSVTDPFNTPEGLVEIYIDGISSLGIHGSKYITYPLTVDEYEPDTFEAVKHRMKQRFTNGGNTIMHIELSDANELSTPSFFATFGGIKALKDEKQSLVHLSYDVDEDKQFLLELNTLKAIIERIQSGPISADNLVDFYYFRFRSLHALSDFHGPISLQTKEAKTLLGDALQEMSKAFAKVYDGSVLVTAVTTDVAHTRRAVRSVNNEAPLDATDAQESAENGDGYSADYPAMFNIILWFGVVFAFALIAVVYAIMDMDPGRDSIIYRMTSTRMKKDN